MLPVVAAMVVAAGSPLHLGDVLREVRERNPDLHAALLRVRAAEVEVSPAGTLEDPKLMVQLWNAPADFSSVPVMLQLSQALPLGGKRRLRAEAARSDAQVVSADEAGARRGVEAAVARAFFDLYLAQRTDAVDAALEKTVVGLREAALARLRSGLTQQVDVLRLQSTEVELRGEREVAEQQIVSASARLNAWMDRDATQVFELTAEPGLLPGLPEVSLLEQRALDSRTEVKAARARIARAEAQVGLAGAARVPDVNLIAAGMHTFHAQGSSNFLFAGVEFNLPLFEGGKTAPRIESASAEVEATREALRGVKDRVAAEVVEAFAQCRAEERLVRLHHQLIPLTEEALSSAESSYASGKTDFLTLLDTLRELQRHQLELAMHLAAYEQRLADLERAVGVELGLLTAAEAGHASHE